MAKSFRSGCDSRHFTCTPFVCFYSPPVYIMSGNFKNSSQVEDASQALANCGEFASVSKGSTTGTRKGSKAVWKSADDAILVATLIKERELGHQTDLGFKPVMFTACVEALRGSELTSGGVPKSSGSAKDHWDKVCDYFDTSIGLLKHNCSSRKTFAWSEAIRKSSGFGWDDTAKICTAPDDVWEKYIQVSWHA